MLEEISTELGAIPPAAWWAIGALSLVTLAAQIAALIDLSRRPSVLWGRKWVWVLIILLLNNAIGVILWFALGRRVPQPIDEGLEAAPLDGSCAGRAVDILYGSDQQGDLS